MAIEEDAESGDGWDRGLLSLSDNEGLLAGEDRLAELEIALADVWCESIRRRD